MTPAVMTRDLLRRALVGHGVILKNYGDEDAVAEAITAHGLTQVVCGKHDGKTCTYAKAFELLTGRRLTLQRKQA